MDNNLYDSLLKAVKMRRSVRHFKPDAIPDDYVDKIIEVARWAPSGFHTQPWEFVVVKKKELKEKIADAAARPQSISATINQGAATPALPGYRNAPVFILLLGDWRAKVGLPGNPEDQDKRVDSLFCSSLASAFLYMHLAAATLGLASCWVSTVSQAGPQRKIKELLGIPEPLRIYDMMAVGHGTHAAIPKVIRNLKGMVHYDDCGTGDFRTDEAVIADAEKTKTWCVSAH